MKINSIVELQSVSKLLLLKTHKACNLHSNILAYNLTSINDKFYKYVISRKDIDILNLITLNYGLLSDDYKTF